MHGVLLACEFLLLLHGVILACEVGVFLFAWSAFGV